MSQPSLAVDLLIAFNLGLASQLHCLGMCGGIVGALSLAMPASARSARGRSLLLACGYNFGRIASYALAGALMAGLARGVLESLQLAHGHRVLQFIAAAMLIATGMSMLGWLPRLTALESIGLRGWRRIQPLARPLLPVDTWPKAVAFGAIWGFLPCALVYSTLLFAASGADAGRAALIMLAFGAGTAPAMVASVCLAARFPARWRAPGWRTMAALVLIAAGLAYPLLPFLGHDAHAGHTAPAAALHHHSSD